MKREFKICRISKDSPPLPTSSAISRMEFRNLNQPTSSMVCALRIIRSFLLNICFLLCRLGLQATSASSSAIVVRTCGLTPLASSFSHPSPLDLLLPPTILNSRRSPASSLNFGGFVRVREIRILHI
ncbi:hypothetical protein D0Y65_022506 [Glycine soja]|uniref:Uncharacterized protein n=1 Tax=Glycine soja TaxID=3848 RepID=A0A0B2PTP9_GLYSO|nr:hypothetical protein glysoja_026652 [Glycine soja]RZC00167.1 hypothetical protein D0Y65_022506 [Glycine soja]